MLVAFAEDISRDAVISAEEDLRRVPISGPARELSLLLAAAFPPLFPRVDWQFDAVESIAHSGWRSRHTHRDMLASLLSSVGSLEDHAGVRRGLRRAVWAEKVRIALRELLPLRLGGAEIRTTARELSELAEASIEVAFREAMLEADRKFGVPRLRDGERSTAFVLGMGKLGGLELNAGSDVDLMFVYDTDDGEGEVSLHEYWTRVARRVTSTLEDPTADGFVWRVDLRLRPEGSAGAIVNSFAAAERYYETWGRLWERAALLRARPVAGDLKLGEQFRAQVIAPFVYRRAVDPKIATQLAELVDRSRAELSVDPVRDLKLGVGGIREAEFFVQSLQLIWGGQEESLRVTGTLLALSRLRARGLVSDREARQIASSYLLLRRLEHRVQWTSGLQTHLLPMDGEELERIARSMAYQNGEQLRFEVERIRNDVRALFRSLLPSIPRPPSRYQALLLALSDGDSLAVDRLVAEWFGSADVSEHLLALARRPDALLGSLTHEQYPELGDQLLEALRECSDPELSAQYLRAFFARFVTPGPYKALLGEDAYTLRRFITVLGASAFVGDLIVARPDLADVILLPSDGVIDPENHVHDEVQHALASLPDGATEHERRERFIEASRGAKGRVMMEVAVADLAGELRIRDATRLLSELAEAVLQAAVRFELGDEPRGLAVIAMGKLGGRDIGYGSDLDVIFVYDPKAAPDRDEAAHYFSKVAQRVIRLISEAHAAGQGYELDTRLRPSGSAGMLVTSLEAFARYHGLGPTSGRPSVFASGEAWERQALLRARCCAGDVQLGNELTELAHYAAYEGGAPDVQSLHHMRMRMQRELGREGAGRFDLKFGYGGLLDVEFAAQWLQMQYGADLLVRTTDTEDALEALNAGNYLDRQDYETLRDGYRFLRRLEQRIVVLRGRSENVIHTDDPGLGRLARRMSFQSRSNESAEEALLERYRSVTHAIRTSYERVLDFPRE